MSTGWISVKRHRLQNNPSAEPVDTSHGTRVRYVSPTEQLVETVNIVRGLDSLTRPQHKSSRHKVWYGIDRGDDRYRLRQNVPYRLSRKSDHRGRLIDSFSKYKLLRIAWKIGVSNPEGFSKDDAEFLGLDDYSGFEHFLSGWEGMRKTQLTNYVWNRLHDLDQVYFD